MQSPTIKTSTIFVATGRRTKVFRSLDEIPSGLRRRLHENLSGPNTKTLIVADRRGREYLLKILQRATRASIAPTEKPIRSKRTDVLFTLHSAKRYWLEITLISLLAVAGWALFYGR